MCRGFLTVARNQDPIGVACEPRHAPGEVKSLEPLLQGPRATKNASVAKMAMGGCDDKMTIRIEGIFRARD